MSELLFTESYQRLLLDLLRTPTVSPMETGCESHLVEAQRAYAVFADTLGFATLLHQAPPPSALDAPCVPVTVRERAAQMGAAFFESQPNLVLRLGPPRPTEQTLMFNFHMDTVAGEVPVGYAAGRFCGRGAVDMKGSGVALLAGLAEAIRCRPSLADDIAILIQCVSGEEGGAMGVYGTRLLTEAGFVGRLNIVAEPSGGRFFDHATTSMTARVVVQGRGSTDDAPERGHNATLLLGFIAQHMGLRLSERVVPRGGKVCVAGLHTGTMHNRVYGSGALLMNFAYDSHALARLIESEVEGAFAVACAAFARTFGATAVAAATAEVLPDICTLQWLKRGLPVLANRDVAMERVLATAGVSRWPETERERCFTCDAMWVQVPGCYTVVFGPGSLGANGAHAEDEHIDLADLETYARSIARLTLAFHAAVAC